MTAQQSIHNRTDLSQEEKDDIITAHVDKAIQALRELADLTEVSIRSAADTAIWASNEGVQPQ